MKTVALCLAASAFATQGLRAAPMGPDPIGHVFAKATLTPTTGHTASATVLFMHTSSGIEIVAKVKGTTPGLHGLHVHDKGECGPDGMAAGGHYNPTETPHGAPNATNSHVGDFGNITVGEDGTGTLILKVQQAAHPTYAHWSELTGHAIVLHEKVDDLTTQPTGNSGGRIACGIIEEVD